MKERRNLAQVSQIKERTEIERPLDTRIAPEADQYRMYRGAETPEEGIKLTDYWRAIRKRLWLIIGLVALVTTLTAIYISRRPNYYDARATIQVDLEQENPDLVGKERRPILGNPDPAYHNTQLQILTSSSLLRRVAKELDLENNKAADLVKKEESSTLQKVLATVGLASKNEENKEEAVPVTTSAETSVNGDTIEDLAEAKRLQPIVEAIKKKLTVEPRRESRQTSKETRLIDISFQHNNPEFAAVLVNKIADVFTRRNAEKKNKTNSETNTYLKDRIASLQAEIQKDEKQLERDTRAAGILEVDKEKTLAVDALVLLNKNLIDAENERKNAEAQLNAVQRNPEALSALAEDTQAKRYIDDTKSKIDDLEKERQKLLQEVTAEFPDVKALDKQITSLKSELEDYRKRNRAALLEKFKGNYAKAKEAEDKIRAEFNRQRGTAEGQNQAAINLKLLQTRLETHRDLLKDLYEQMRTNDVVAAGTENNISILDSAVPPDKPTGPARISTVILAGILALAFGCGLALFFEYLDDTLRTTEDIENYLRLPAIAVIPTIEKIPKRKLLVAGAEEKAASNYEKNGLLIKNDARSSLAEAYRQLRTSVLLSTAGHAPKSLLITSSVPSEGKTTNAVNTAISLAQTGAKVLIIDADMRRPRLHNIFQKPNGQGLSTILSSEMSEAEILNIVQQDEETNLYLLSSGPVPPNPAELIGSEEMTKVVRIMENKFTHVVIDSPPIASFTDGVLIATMVDGVLLVVHAGKSSRHVVKRSRQLLLDVGAKIFGVVLNNVNIKSQENYYYYQSYQYQSHYDNPDRD